MRIAVLADIHANLGALEAVIDDIDAWAPELVIMGGDIVNRGPQPRPCVDLVLEKVAAEGWQAIKGNHEDFVLSHLEDDWSREGPEFEIRRNSYWTFQRLNGQLPALAQLPDAWQGAGPAGTRLRVVHASMLGNRHGIYEKNSDQDLRRKIAPPPDVFAAGHTHRPLIRNVDDTLVLNVGSVGCPFDGDGRACYAQLTHDGQAWQAELVRVEYDRAATEQLFYDTGLLEDGGDLVRIMLAEFRTCQSLVYDWAREYQAAVLAGDIPIGESVTRYLAECGVVDG